MEDVTDEKKGEPIKKKHVAYACIVPFGDVLESAAFGEDLAQGVFQPASRMVGSGFGLSQLKEADKITSPSNEEIEGHADQQ
jgi:hypothetical protein